MLFLSKENKNHLHASFVLCFLALISHLNSSEKGVSSCFSQATDSIEPCCHSHWIIGRSAIHLIMALFDLKMQMRFYAIASTDFEMIPVLVWERMENSIAKTWYPQTPSHLSVAVQNLRQNTFLTLQILPELFHMI